MAEMVQHGREGARSLGNDLLVGALAGVAGGLAFGAVMGMTGMLPMVAMLVGSESAVVGFGVHIVISAVIGAIYGVGVNLLGLRQAASVLPGVGIGLVYGAAWWVLGPLLIMPTMLGMGPQFGAATSEVNIMSLGGHLIYGALLGAVFALVNARR
jgi:uncharacterized membrane protein YagU involved in acid resistance